MTLFGSSGQGRPIDEGYSTSRGGAGPADALATKRALIYIYFLPPADAAEVRGSCYAGKRASKAKELKLLAQATVARKYPMRMP